MQNWINQPLTSLLSHDQVPQEEKFNFLRNAENILEDKDIPERVGRRYGSLGYSEVAETSVDGKIRKLNSISYKINLSELVLDEVTSSFDFIGQIVKHCQRCIGSKEVVLVPKELLRFS